MSAERSRLVIDSLEFAGTEQMLCGSLEVPDLTRLRDSLYDTVGRVDFRVRGGHDARHRPTLSVEVNGVLHLRCQRCLGNLDYPLEISSVLLLAAPPSDAAGAEAEAQEPDWIEPSAELDIGSLVEDEIILGLPYAPRHPEGECGADRLGKAESVGESAFAQLAALRRKPH
jgi:uncharacterized protein